MRFPGESNILNRPISTDMNRRVHIAEQSRRYGDAGIRRKTESFKALDVRLLLGRLLGGFPSTGNEDQNENFAEMHVRSLARGHADVKRGYRKVRFIRTPDKRYQLWLCARI